MMVDRREKALFSISFIAFAVFLTVAFASADSSDWPFAEGKPFRSVHNLCGPLGSLLAFICYRLFGGLFAWFVPVSVFCLGASIIAGKLRVVGWRLIKITLLVVLLNAFFALITYTQEITLMSGFLGKMGANALSSVFGKIGSTIILIACLLLVVHGEIKRTSGVLSGLRFRLSWFSWIPWLLRNIWKALPGLFKRLISVLSAVRTRSKREVHRDREKPIEPKDEILEVPWTDIAPKEETLPLKDQLVRNPPRTAKKRHRTAPAPSITAVSSEQDGEKTPIEEASLPDLSILEEPKQDDGTPYTPEKLKSWSTVLEEKLRDYNVEGRVSVVHHGPLITTFEFEPAPGVKIKDIVSRSDDLALALRAKSLRMIAPIPGRAAVGIEIPNPESRTVRFKEVLEEIPERLRVSGIMIALGVDVVGNPYYFNLCGAPHLLVAGTTGSGKSVCLNVIISSILFQHHPSEVKLIIIDPKVVEMNAYNGIPHLIYQVVTDPKIAAKVFSYLTSEMQRRNELFRKSGVKNIESYNSKIALGRTKPGEWSEKLPYIVLVIDELGDLTLTKGVDIETFLSRISNMARAVGIHMVVATQRPSVDVIVGKTKANFPTRIAFRVASKVDSRTILDSVGAEKLIGKGDMLHMDAKHPEPVRLHGAFISEEELERLISHWKSYEYEEPSLAFFEARSEVTSDEERDPLFEDAKEVILHYRQGSTSLLQRKLHVGYARAARLLDQMEQAGIVGPPDSSKPREVLIEEREEIGPAIED